MRRMHPVIRLAGVAAAAVGAAFVTAARADEAKRVAYGKHLSGECSACHRIDGIDNGIPSITGWPVDDFVATVEFYRNGARPNPAMISVAQSLDEDQIKALAAYYGTLPKPPKKSAQTR
jgi:cytochrome c553